MPKFPRTSRSGATKPFLYAPVGLPVSRSDKTAHHPNRSEAAWPQFPVCLPYLKHWQRSIVAATHAAEAHADLSLQCIFFSIRVVPRLGVDSPRLGLQEPPPHGPLALITTIVIFNHSTADFEDSSLQGLCP